jgi:Mis12-Mtw1 protein family
MHKKIQPDKHWLISSHHLSCYIDQPPPNVKPSDYYLYTPSRVPDPLRMRQVLAWCARNVADKQWKLGREGVIDSKAATAATHIQDTLIKSLMNGQINTSWYHRPVRLSSY